MTLHETCMSYAPVRANHQSRPPPKLPTSVLLVTARVRVADRFGVYHIARVLVDQGSSLVSESLSSQRLRLALRPLSVTIYGVNEVQTGVS